MSLRSPLTDTPMRTIPQIAEELRQHCNRDNDAPRLIAELVLPILADTIGQAPMERGAQDRITREASRLACNINERVPIRS